MEATPTTEERRVLTLKSNDPSKQRDLIEVHVDELLELIVEAKGSDLHLANSIPPIYRVDGDLIPGNYTKFTPQVIQRMCYDILTDEQIQRFENQLELDFSYQLGKSSRFRVNLFRDRGAVAAAFRTIPYKIPTLEDLGQPEIVRDLTKKHRGLILVTGPTGSGKSTTLAAMLGEINRNYRKHIITIEDPIEYLHSHQQCVINQRELGQDTKSFPNALRAALREDPDILLVGEMRDLDTMDLAIHAAETGHLVFATVHTNSAAQTVDRIVDVFPVAQQEQIRVMLSNNLVAVLTQQLLPKAGGGRVCAQEIMVASPAIRNLIREAKAHQINSIIQTSAHLGMKTMDQCLRDLYNEGNISYQTALERAMNIEELKKMMLTDGTLPEDADATSLDAYKA
ncbi:MAG TPA: type IV pilus twitching motility protein PilT [Armatimonadota bacterium]|nr:type IV pilus twitching motility protein PilT [Armatimonadota bacterium]